MVIVGSAQEKRPSTVYIAGPEKMLCPAQCEAAGPAVYAAHNCHASGHLLLTGTTQHYLRALAHVAWWQLVYAAAAVVTACQSHRPSAVAAANATAGGRQSSHSACAAAADVAAAESHGGWSVPKQQESASDWTWAECIHHAEADAGLQQ